MVVRPGVRHLALDGVLQRDELRAHGLALLRETASPARLEVAVPTRALHDAAGRGVHAVAEGVVPGVERDARARTDVVAQQRGQRQALALGRGRRVEEDERGGRAGRRRLHPDEAGEREAQHLRGERVLGTAQDDRGEEQVGHGSDDTAERAAAEGAGPCQEFWISSTPWTNSKCHGS